MHSAPNMWCLSGHPLSQLLGGAAVSTYCYQLGVDSRGGGGTASLKVAITIVKLSPPFFRAVRPVFFDRPLILGVADHHTLKSNSLKANLYANVTPTFLLSISCMNIIYQQISTKWSENKHILQVTTLSWFLVWSWPAPFLPSNELTAPIFLHSPLPLRAEIWQWVAIWYLSSPPPPTKGLDYSSI